MLREAQAQAMICFGPHRPPPWQRTDTLFVIDVLCVGLDDTREPVCTGPISQVISLKEFKLRPVTRFQRFCTRALLLCIAATLLAGCGGRDEGMAPISSGSASTAAQMHGNSFFDRLSGGGDIWMPTSSALTDGDATNTIPANYGRVSGTGLFSTSAIDTELVDDDYGDIDDPWSQAIEDSQEEVESASIYDDFSTVEDDFSIDSDI